MFKLNLALLSILFLSCVDNSTKDKNTSKKKETKTESTTTKWALKVIMPDGKSLDVKAVDANGNLFDVNAIQDSDQDSFLNIKAFVQNKKLPVKVLLTKEKNDPVKAIDKGGLSYSLVAVLPEGEKMKIRRSTTIRKRSCS